MLFHRNRTIQARGKKILNKAIIEMIQRRTVRILLLLNEKKGISFQDKTDEDPNQNG